MIRIAAVGDVHVNAATTGRFRPALADLGQHADVLLLAGDLTCDGTADEARCVAREFGGLPVPVVAVLGNHDYHSHQAAEVTDVLTAAGIIVLEGTGTVLDCDGVRLGIAGVKGFGGGFASLSASAFGEDEMRDFVGHAAASAGALRSALLALDCDIRIALTHYAPVPETLAGEPLEIYPFLGSHLLGQAIDDAPANLAIHGHAHYGVEHGCTPGGVQVRNVAHPVIRRPYRVYRIRPRPVRRLARRRVS